MATELVDASKLDACCTAEANAIRAKTGSSAHIAYDWANSKGFADAIAEIPSGGGSSVKNGTYTPVTDATGPSFDMGADLNHFVVYATSIPETSSKWFKCAICDFSKESDQNIVSVASNNSGTGLAGNAIFGINWFSKNGNTISCTNTGTTGGTNAGYWAGGVTYQWYAW